MAESFAAGLAASRPALGAFLEENSLKTFGIDISGHWKGKGLGPWPRVPGHFNFGDLQYLIPDTGRPCFKLKFDRRDSGRGEDNTSVLVTGR